MIITVLGVLCWSFEYTGRSPPLNCALFLGEVNIRIITLLYPILLSRVSGPLSLVNMGSILPESIPDIQSLL